MDDTESIRSFTMIFELLDPVRVNAKGRVSGFRILGCKLHGSGSLEGPNLETMGNFQ